MIALCVTGDGLEGRTQRIAFTPAKTFAESMRRLEGALHYTVAGSKIASVAAWDKDFNEYIRIDSFDGIEHKSKLRVEVVQPSAPVASPHALAILQASHASVLRLVEKFAGADTAAAVQKIHDATHESITKGDPAPLSRAVKDAEQDLSGKTVHPVVDQRAVLAASRVTPSMSVADGVTNRAADERGPLNPTTVSSSTKAAVTAAPTPSTAAARPPNAPTSTSSKEVPTRDSRVTGTSDGSVSSPPRPTTPYQLASAARATSPVTGLTGGDESLITLFCVYNGAISQRAKAIRVHRTRPDWNALLTTLRNKFKCPLALGYADPDTETCIEIKDGQQLAAIISKDLIHSDSMTVLCWRPDGLGDHEHHQASSTNAKDQTSAALRASTTVDNMRRPTSAKSIGQKLDVSGAFYSEEQLHELFNEIDASHTGYIDLNEFRTFFRNHYDGMGIRDVDAKFENLLVSTKAFDNGKIDFNEFAIIMLKISQW